MPRLFTKFGVLPDPGDVGRERLDQLIYALIKLGRIIEEDKVELGERPTCGYIRDQANFLATVAFRSQRRRPVQFTIRISTFFGNHVRGKDGA